MVYWYCAFYHLQLTKICANAVWLSLYGEVHFVGDLTYIRISTADRGGTVVKALRYKSVGRWFDPSWCHWFFSLT